MYTKNIKSIGLADQFIESILLVGKLERVCHCGLELVQNEFIQGLHDV